MDGIKRFFGAIWIIMAPVVLYFIVSNAMAVFAKADKAIAVATTVAEHAAAEGAKTNAILQWGIIIVIFLPIAAGLVIFGLYAVKGEYNSKLAE